MQNADDPAGRDALKIAFRPSDPGTLGNGIEFFVAPNTYTHLCSGNDYGHTSALLETQIVHNVGDAALNPVPLVRPSPRARATEQ